MLRKGNYLSVMTVAKVCDGKVRNGPPHYRVLVKLYFYIDEDMSTSAL